jgi:hypothetical protein
MMMRATRSGMLHLQRSSRTSSRAENPCFPRYVACRPVDQSAEGLSGIGFVSRHLCENGIRKFTRSHAERF